MMKHSHEMLIDNINPFLGGLLRKTVSECLIHHARNLPKEFRLCRMSFLKPFLIHFFNIKRSKTKCSDSSIIVHVVYYNLSFCYRVMDQDQSVRVKESCDGAEGGHGKKIKEEEGDEEKEEDNMQSVRKERDAGQEEASDGAAASLKEEEEASSAANGTAANLGEEETRSTAGR